MRVALLSHSASGGDAIGRQIADKVAYFVSRGADVRVFVSSDHRLNPDLRPYTTRFSPPRARGPHWQYLSSADLVFVEYSQHDSLFDLVPALAGGRPKIVFDYHGVTPPNLGGANHRDLLERGCRNRGLVWTADVAIVHSRFARDELTVDTGFPAERIRSLGFAIDPVKFSPGAAVKRLRMRLGLHHEARLLLFVGRLAPNKRAPILIDAVALLRDRTPPVHAVIVGDCGGAYSSERDRCRERAARLGIADRIHFLGRVDDVDLRDAYRDADVLVIPSIHEGFCIPIVEAMACGTPVVAARAAAAPETVGDAGLTFARDDAADLARQIERVFRPPSTCTSGAGAVGFSTAALGPGVALSLGRSGRNSRPPAASFLVKPGGERKRIAVVSPRFGAGFVGGAETSLRTLAVSMADAGNAVEVFALGTAEDSTTADGLKVHRFRPESIDADRHAAAAHTLRLPGGLDDADAAADFLDHSARSARLVEALGERGPFDVVVVGPYLPGLTRDVAAAFRDRVLLLPCFHDEPYARMSALLDAFQGVGGVLYHSPEEKQFAESSLGLNHPNAHVVGTLLDVDTPGDPRYGRKRVGTGRRYLLYAGRYCREKGLPEAWPLPADTRPTTRSDLRLRSSAKAWSRFRTNRGPATSASLTSSRDAT